MRQSIVRPFVLMAALTASVAVCHGQGQPIPTITQAQLSHMPQSQIPTIFRDAAPPYAIHETDGLSRNPDDCIKWGCVDVNGR